MLKTFDKIYLASLPRAIVPKRPLDLCTSSIVFFHIYTNIFTLVYRHKKKKKRDPDKVLRRKTSEHTRICS